MKITCIDFETANPFYGSVCAMGIALIDGDEIKSVESQLIKPHTKYGVFNRDNIRVHGITQEMVKDAPEFNAHYETVKHLIADNMLAAHNTVFDTAVLKDVLTIYGIPIPSFEYVCSCELAKSLWKDVQNHKLHTISSHLNYKFKHHDAGEDAGACANIIISAMKMTGLRDIKALAKFAGINVGTVKGGEPHVLSKDYLDTGFKSGGYWKKPAVKKIVPTTLIFDPQHPLYKKEVAITGDFSNGLSREAAIQSIVNAGGTMAFRLSERTDFIVNASLSGKWLVKGKESSKIIAARQLVAAGAKLRIISEEEFLKMLGK